VAAELPLKGHYRPLRGLVEVPVLGHAADLRDEVSVLVELHLHELDVVMGVASALPD
jgi:hypothetical protein